MKERAIAFGPNDGMVGILTEPEAATRAPYILIFNAGFVHRIGPGRLGVDIARKFARAGFPVLRFDFSGIGDSAPRALHRPNPIAGGIADARDAMDHLCDAYGARQFVLFGLCSGARHAHHVALADRRVVGAILLDGPAYPTFRYWAIQVRDHLDRPRHLLAKATRRALHLLAPPNSKSDARTPVDDDGEAFFPPEPPRHQMAKDLRELAARNVSLLCVNSGERREYGYEGQLRDAFRRVRLGNCLTERRIAGADHLYFTQIERAALFEIVGTWLEERAPLWSSRAGASS